MSEDRCFLCDAPLTERFVICIPEPDGTPDHVEICRRCNYGEG